MPKRKEKAGSRVEAKRQEVAFQSYPGPSLLNNRFLGGVADTARVTMRYTDFLTLTSAGGVISTNVYRGNSGFDPDQSGTGVQPVWWDDYSLFYNRYRILGSRCTVMFAQQTNTGLGCFGGVVPQHSTAAFSLENYAAQPYAATIGFGANTPGRVVTSSVTTAKFLGYQSGVMGSDDLAALYNANPAHVWYWHVWMQSVDQSTALTASMIVTIDYDVMWFDKVDGALDLQARFKRVEGLRALSSSCGGLVKKSLGASTSSSAGADKGDEKTETPQALQAGGSFVDAEYVSIDPAPLVARRTVIGLTPVSVQRAAPSVVSSRSAKPG